MNYKSFLSVLTAVLFCFNIGQTQDEQNQDQTLFDGKSIKFTGVWGGSNHYASLYENAKIGHGAFVLAEINKDFLIGWNNFNSKGSGPDDLTFTIFTNELLLGYAHKSYKSVHPIVMLGAGTSRILQTNPVTPGIDFIDNVFLLKPTVGLEINAFKWFRIGLEAGYRLSIGANGNYNFTDEDISSLFFGLRFKLGWSWS